MEEVLLADDHKRLGEMVEMCKTEVMRQQPEQGAALLAPLNTTASIGAQRYTVLACMAYSANIEAHVRERSDPVRFDPFFRMLRDQLHVLGFRECELGVPASTDRPPVYTDCLHFVNVMCLCYKLRFDYFGRWGATVKRRG